MSDTKQIFGRVFKRHYLPKLSTSELVAELSKREGVVHHIVNSDQKWYLCIDNIETEDLIYAGGDIGPARILVVKL